MKKQQNMVIGLVGLLLVATPALADKAVPGTRVSYKVASEVDSEGHRHNTSMIFVDARGDSTGQTYMAFFCNGGARLYTNTTLGTAAEINSGTIGAMSYRMDSGAYKTVEGGLRLDNKTGQRSSVNIYDSQFSQAFLTASQTVTLQVNRTGSTPVSYTFPVKGLAQAYRAVNNCD